MRGIGETFAANPATGSGSISVPIYVSPGRSGFGPSLALSYDTGSGNGPFGFGWSLDLPTITRKTDKGLPRYNDAEDSDVFLLSGAEDLVPRLEDVSGQWVRVEATRTMHGRTYAVTAYRPRTEGLFARIERWTSQSDPTDVFWRSITGQNVTSWYGRTGDSRIADPADPSRIFSWLLCETHDDKGNVAAYVYKAENSQAVVGPGTPVVAHERNRSDLSRSANRYLKRILYGNRTPYLPDPTKATATALPSDWCFEVVFDYGDHPGPAPSSSDVGKVWPRRDDPFTSCRAGFEVRTYRLCRRVLMFHHFPAEAGVGQDCLVRSTDFTYAQDLDPTVASAPVYAFLQAVAQTGYRRKSTGYLARSLPPVEFGYTRPTISETVREVDPASLENLPQGLDGRQHQWVDLDGEGIPGILSEQAGAWRYKRNLSPIGPTDGPAGPPAAWFAPAETVRLKPSLGALGGGQQLLDLDGDGRLELVQYAPPTAGFHARTENETWEPFQSFSRQPVLDWNDPNLKFIDLTGDGHADILITKDGALCWNPSLGRSGFGPAQRVSQPVDEELGPRVVFADRTETIVLADFSGDGLVDIGRIRNGEVSYWPNLGYGRFGAKVSMDNAPWFEAADQFDPGRVHLADIDGSGSADILYVSTLGATIYFNQSGNSWSRGEGVPHAPLIDCATSVLLIDLLGQGTTCLVWSSSLPGDARRAMRYIDLMGGVKPHLLVSVVNNLGAETRIQYATSTRFYLADKAAGHPWITRLPFPVHVVERVEVFDHISRNRFVTRYAYHHGHFDGVDREFRGFGMVEQWDTETYAALSASGDLPVGDNIDAASHVPPVLTRSWRHTGAYLGSERISNHFAGLGGLGPGEYYREPGQTDAQAAAALLDDTVLPAGLTVEEEREACRALKGSMLRQEVYALDGTTRDMHPYSVSEQNFTIERLQPLAANRHAVFLTYAREALTHHYERDPDDPRTTHALTLKVDDFGNVLQEVSVAYGRRTPDPQLATADRENQTRIQITLHERDFTNAVETTHAYRAPLIHEDRTYELTGAAPAAGATRFTFATMLAKAATAAPLAYDATPTVGLLQRRLIEQARTLYRADDMTAALAPGLLESLALPFETWTLALTTTLVSSIYGARVDDLLMAEAGYVHSQGDADWWIPSGRAFLSPTPNDPPASELAYARAHFFLPHRFRDPFHTATVSTETLVTYDPYDLLVLETRDPLGNLTTAGERAVSGALVASGNDYRVLQPRLVTDPNRNRVAAAFDALGMVVGTAVMGKAAAAPVEGDSLVGFVEDLSEAEIQAYAADPLGAAAWLGRATTRLLYDSFAYHRTRTSPAPKPAATYSLARETHDADPVPAGGLKIQHALSYSDGFGREIQKKARAEPGPGPRRDSDGAIMLDSGGQPLPTLTDVDTRWVGSGWTVFNNKGKPVRQYEPFFTDTHAFEFDVRIGVSPILFYDPVGRAVATLHPDHTWEKLVVGGWRQETWDVNDTVLAPDPAADLDVGGHFDLLPSAAYLPTWRARRIGGAIGPEAEAAATKASHHADTPGIAHFDSLGRPFLTIAKNKAKYSDTPILDPAVATDHETRIIFDIEGNQREVRDALGRTITRHDYSITGVHIHQASMEAGERWLFNDVVGKARYAWDSMGRRFRTTYDPLDRPLDSFVKVGGGADILVGRNVYGESLAAPEARNLREQIVDLFDQAGATTSDDYDFKGNLLSTRRQLAVAYAALLDWSGPVALEPEVYGRRTYYDALNRPTMAVTPDASRTRDAYNEAGLLERVDVNLRGVQLNGQPVWTPFVVSISYDAQGRRQSIAYGNSVITNYDYDPLTSRLVGLVTKRDPNVFPNDDPQTVAPDWPGSKVQNLRYFHDPIGNVVHIRDDAQQTCYFRNKRIDPAADYTYDAVYRLIEAGGREHLGQVGAAPSAPSQGDRPRTGVLLAASDGAAMARYLERYRYDKAGNFLEMAHHGGNPASPAWTRLYHYAEQSQLEAGKVSNRLTSTAIGSVADIYSINDGYDAHGKMLRMPHLQSLQWDHQDHLRMTRRQAVNAADVDGLLRQGEQTWYVYDSTGARVRKVTETVGGQVKDERIYLDGFEIYRRHGSNPLVRETLEVHDDETRIALVETRTSGVDSAPAQVVRFQFGNHLGSAALELGADAGILSYEEYLPYGSTAFQAVAGVAQIPKRYRYIGRERDEETGLNHHGARYYAPWLGVWTSPDPIGAADHPNLYNYCGNNPSSRLDPTGLCGWDGKHRRYKVAKQRKQKSDQISVNRKAGAESEKNYGDLVRERSTKTFQPAQVSTGTGKGSHRADEVDNKIVHEVKSMDADKYKNADGTWNEKKIEKKTQVILKQADGQQKQFENTKEASFRKTGADGTEKIKNTTVIVDVKGKVSKEEMADLRKIMQKKSTSVQKKLGTPGKIGLGVLNVPDEAKRKITPAKPVVAPKTPTTLTKTPKPAIVTPVAPKSVATSASELAAKTTLKTVGQKALKIVPFVGTVAGVYSMVDEFRQGNYLSAVLDGVGLVPVVGDAVDAVRLGVSLIEMIPPPPKPPPGTFGRHID